ncbi:MAG: LysR family transcriptional regulator [Lautropia sp.]
MLLDFLGLQAFIAIAEAGGFQRAAGMLSLTQTAVSHRMRKLEDSLGVRLIERTSRGVTLTHAGHALLPRARRAMRELAASCDDIRAYRGDAESWLAFACLPTLAATVFAPLLKACAERFPDAAVRVFDVSIPEIRLLVESRNASFGLTVLQGGGVDLVAERIAAEPFVLACPPAHPLARRDRVAWAELEDVPLVRISLPSGNSMTIDDALGPLRDRLRWRYEAQHNAFALAMVRAGLGLTVVPALSVHPGDGVRVVAIDKPAIARELAVVRRIDTTLTGADAWLRDALIGRIREALAGG